MKKIRLINIGKTTEVYLKQGLDIYQSRLKHYCDFEMIIIKEGTYNKGSLKKTLSLEAQRIEEKIRKNSYLIILDETGKSISSVGLSKKFEEIANSGVSAIDFVIGGAYGLDQDLKKKANLLLKLGDITYTHQIIRLVMIEQIYRAFTIIKGESYHH